MISDTLDFISGAYEGLREPLVERVIPLLTLFDIGVKNRLSALSVLAILP